MLMPTDSIKEIQNAVTIIHEDCEWIVFAQNKL